MDKVEKFKELLDQYRVLGVEFYTNMVVKDFNELVKTEKELIKMYEEALNESIQQEEEAQAFYKMWL